MVRSAVRNFATWALAALMAVAPAASWGQNAEPKPEQGKAGEPGKDAGRVDPVADASRNMTGPAANSECVWLGERAISLMRRDDLDTAFRYLDLYDRFGCPGEHIQISFPLPRPPGQYRPQGDRDIQRAGCIRAGSTRALLPPQPPPLPTRGRKKSEPNRPLLN